VDGVETEKNIVVLNSNRELVMGSDLLVIREVGKRSVVLKRGVTAKRHTFSSSISTAIGYSSSPELGASAMASGAVESQIYQENEWQRPRGVEMIVRRVEEGRLDDCGWIACGRCWAELDGWVMQ
jgi:hypothetical protein